MSLHSLRTPIALCLIAVFGGGAAVAQTAPEKSVNSPYVFYKRVKITPLPQMAKVTTTIGQQILANAGGQTPSTPAPAPVPVVQPDPQLNGKPEIPLATMSVNAGNYYDIEPVTALTGMTPNIPSALYYPSAALPGCGNSYEDTVYTLSNDPNNRAPLYYSSTSQVWNKSSQIQFNRQGIVSPAFKQLAPSAVGDFEALQTPLGLHFTLQQREPAQYLGLTATGTLDRNRVRALRPTSVEFIPSDGSRSKVAGFRAGIANQFPNTVGSTSYCKVPGVSPAVSGPEQTAHEFFLLVSMDRDTSRSTMEGTLRVRFDNDFSGTLNIPVKVQTQFAAALPSFNLNTTSAHYCNSNLQCPHTEFPVGDNPTLQPSTTLVYSEDQTHEAKVAGALFGINANPLKIETYLKHNRRAAFGSPSGIEPAFQSRMSPIYYGAPFSASGISEPVLAAPANTTGVLAYPMSFLPFGSNAEVSTQTYIRVKPATSGLPAGLHTENVTFPLLTTFGPSQIVWQNKFEILAKNYFWAAKTNSNNFTPSSTAQKTPVTSDSLTVLANLTVNTLRVFDFWTEPTRPFFAPNGSVSLTSWAAEKAQGRTPLNHRSFAGRPALRISLEGPDAAKYKPTLRVYRQPFSVSTSSSGITTRTLGSKIYQDTLCRETADIAFRGQSYQCVMYDLSQFPTGTLHGFEVSLTDLSGAKPIRPGQVTLRVTNNSGQGEILLNTTITN